MRCVCFSGTRERSASSRTITASSAWCGSRLAADGARIVSIPDALTTHEPVQDEPGERLAVLRAFERADGAMRRQLPQLAATLAVALSRRAPASVKPTVRNRLRRLLG